ncbi:hypothetical protein ACTS91_06150 [Empedobacter falsenii]|uniref:Uncharacterized protein n=1 Tax=Empedobacter falsenii TaxID=343874 RepID=A0A376G410_9FLAO|nr:hypothetical protein [Empedobacter falsenii]STD53386.1 Uncharacterised protein [Empedobacter falsenii]
MAQPILEINFKKISYDLDKVNLKYREIYYFHFFIHRLSILIIGIHMSLREERKKVINASKGSAQATLGCKPLY